MAVIWPPDFANIFQPQVQNWLSNNPTKRPLYVILFQDIPQEVDYYTNSEDTTGTGAAPSVQYQLHNSTAPGWQPFVTAVNMNGLSGTNFHSSDGTNDCIAYINKIIAMASNNPPRTLLISASAGGYSNTNWYFDYACGSPTEIFGYDYEGILYPDAINAEYGVTNVDPTASVIGTCGTNVDGAPLFTTQATNVTGYFTGGWDAGMGSGPGNTNSFAVSGQVVFFGNSGWYIMSTIDSFSGQRVTGQSSYLTWFASNAFGGTNYSNTPVGAVTYVDEPSGPYGEVTTSVYYGDWAAGKSFGVSAWAAQVWAEAGPPFTVQYFQAVGDPFVRR
jgi:hypothetical protein